MTTISLEKRLLLPETVLEVEGDDDDDNDIGDGDSVKNLPQLW